MSNIIIKKIKADFLYFLALCLISGGLFSLTSCKVFRCNKKSKDDVKNYKEEPALYGTPVSEFQNNLQH